MVNVNAQIDAVERGLETKDVDGVRSHVQTLSQTYPSPIEDVWDAVTSADRIPRWFLPITGDLRLGGTYQFEGNAGGVIRHCAPPRSGSAEFSVTWGMGQGEPAIVHVRLRAVGATSTRLELENVAAVDSIPEGFWEQFGPSATGMGWDSGLLGLAQYYSGGEDGITPEAAAAWVASPEGKAFMRASADAWAAVHERWGADPAAAQTAANTTYGMYTGETTSPEM